jgi:hypothetical protein
MVARGSVLTEMEGEPPIVLGPGGFGTMRRRLTERTTFIG